MEKVPLRREEDSSCLAGMVKWFALSPPSSDVDRFIELVHSELVELTDQDKMKLLLGKLYCAQAMIASLQQEVAEKSSVKNV
jgi:hypothetical protein